MNSNDTTLDQVDAESIGARIDWGLAAATGRRLARPGPKTTAYTLDAAYAELADAATRAEAPVRELTGLADGLRVELRVDMKNAKPADDPYLRFVQDGQNNRPCLHLS